jgi:hypothetical protein
MQTVDSHRHNLGEKAMNNSKVYSIILIGAFAGQTAHATQPPDVVQK